MKRLLLWTGAVAGAAALATAAGQFPTARKGFRYWSPDMGELEIVGVCNADPEAFACWKPDGTPDAGLTKETKAFFSLRKWFRPSGLKDANRVVVTRWTDRAGRGGFYGDLKTGNGQPLYNSGVADAREKDPTLLFYNWLTAPDAASIDLTAQAILRTAESRPVPLEVGSAFQSPTGTYKVASLEEMPLPEDREESSRRIWRFELAWIPKKPGTPRPPAGFDAVDGSGRIIQAAGSDGDPATPNAGWPKSPNAPVILNYRNDVWDSRVRPDKMAGLKIREYERRSIAFKNVRLQPKAKD